MTGHCTGGPTRKRPYEPSGKGSYSRTENRYDRAYSRPSRRTCAESCITGRGTAHGTCGGSDITHPVIFANVETFTGWAAYTHSSSKTCQIPKDYL